MKLYPVILAGGGGTRLWPLSREHYPKQFLSIAGERSLLQQTMLRLDGLSAAAAAGGPIEVGAPLLVCNEEHRFLVAEQARVIDRVLAGIMLEPAGRNTAPALTAAALHCQAEFEDAVLLMMPADHVITRLDRFHEAVQAGHKLAGDGHLVTFGIVPDKPETGYGYIRKGDAIGGIGAGSAAPVQIAAFAEKPDAVTAAEYLASGDYLWNSGIFMMQASVWLGAIEKYRPDVLKGCQAAFAARRADGDFVRLGAEEFKACPSDSVDYAVMERLTRDGAFPGAVVPLDAGWSDVGSWSSLWEITERDGQGNALKGDVCAIDANGNLVFAEHRFVAVVGCEDLVIVETPDAVMVTPRSRAQDVKKITAWLKDRDREERLTHRRVYRPWGSYEGVDAGGRFQVKRITVKPGGKLSLQMHHHRAEHWIVVRGTARVTRGEEDFLLSENESTFIPLGVRHRLENPGAIPLELIEVQSGAYLGEDDIVRFEDVYNRN